MEEKDITKAGDEYAKFWYGESWHSEETRKIARLAFRAGAVWMEKQLEKENRGIFAS